MESGIYAVKFNVQGNMGEGIVVINNGDAHGGDHGYFYKGSLVSNNGNIAGHITATRFDNSAQSVFGQLATITLAVSGADSGDHILLAATAAEAPGALLKIDCRRISNL